LEPCDRRALRALHKTSFVELVDVSLIFRQILTERGFFNHDVDSKYVHPFYLYDSWTSELLHFVGRDEAEIVVAYAHPNYDDEIIIAAMNVWTFGSQIRRNCDNLHWLFEEACERGVWDVLIDYSTQYKCRGYEKGEAEYTELLCQFLLYYGEIGLYDFLLAICNSLSWQNVQWMEILEAMNQAWEIQFRWEAQKKCKKQFPWFCKCDGCKEFFCCKSETECGCRARRHKQGLMFGYEVHFLISSLFIF
jgi:hypothetical protein